MKNSEFRPGHGIDGPNEVDPTTMGSKALEAVRHMYGHGVALQSKNVGEVAGDYKAKKLPGLELVRRATAGTRPLLGEGTPESAEQTGIRGDEGRYKPRGF